MEEIQSTKGTELPENTRLVKCRVTTRQLVYSQGTAAHRAIIYLKDDDFAKFEKNGDVEFITFVKKGEIK